MQELLPLKSPCSRTCIRIIIWGMEALMEGVCVCYAKVEIKKLFYMQMVKILKLKF